MRSTLAILLALLLAPRASAQQAGLDPACAAGNAAACVQTASRLLKEGKTAADTASAVAHQLKACNLDNGPACNSYGYALVTGLGMPSKPELSARYYLRGCELGAPVACRNMPIRAFPHPPERS